MTDMGNKKTIFFIELLLTRQLITNAAVICLYTILNDSSSIGYVSVLCETMF